MRFPVSFQSIWVKLIEIGQIISISWAIRGQTLSSHQFLDIGIMQDVRHFGCSVVCDLGIHKDGHRFHTATSVAQLQVQFDVMRIP